MAVKSIVEAVKMEARIQLLDRLDDVSQRKVLLLDSTVVGPLDLIANPSDLKDHGVESWYRLGKTPVAVECPHLIFIVRCNRPDLLDCVASQITADESQLLERSYHVVFIPRQTEQCMQRLQQRNVQANVSIIEYPLHFFPSDTDVLSMEVPGVFRDFHVQGDPGNLFYMAKALVHLQARFGVIPMIHAIGAAGKSVLDAMMKLRKEESFNDEPQRGRELSQKGVPPVAPHVSQRDEGENGREPVAPKITEAVIIDRRVDVYSVLCSQFTYQALIDTAYGITSHIVDVSSAEWADPKKKQIKLSPEDEFYQEIRDLHIDKLGPLLQRRAEDIQTVYAEKDSVARNSSTEMASYVKKFMSARETHELLQTHINMAHDLKKSIQEAATRLRLEDDVTSGASQNFLESLEDMIDSQRPMHEVLALLCLHSLVNNGIRQKPLNVVKAQFLQAYGFEHLLTLNNLERVGMLKYMQGKSPWPSIKRQFNLFVEDSNAERDISYAYSGYAPLSVRLVEMTKSLPRGWRSCPEALALLDGFAQEVPQTVPAREANAAREPGQPSLVLVCFLGGVTHGEIAALRRLSELEEGRRKFLIVTTELLNTKKFFESMRCEQAFEKKLSDARAPDGQRRGWFR